MITTELKFRISFSVYNILVDDNRLESGNILIILFRNLIMGRDNFFLLPHTSTQSIRYAKKTVYNIFFPNKIY